MKKISLLRPPKLQQPLFRVQIPDTSLPMLKSIFESEIDTSLKAKADDLLQVINSEVNNRLKISAIKDMRDLLLEESYYDEKLVPALFNKLNDKDLRYTALEALSAIASQVSIYDREMLDVFDRYLMNDTIAPCAEGLRILFSRGFLKSGIVRKLTSEYPKASNFRSAVSLAAAINTYVTSYSLTSQDDLQLIVGLNPNGKFQDSQPINYQGASYTTKEYVELIKIKMPEIQSLLVNSGKSFQISSSKLSAEALNKLSIIIERDGKVQAGVISVLAASSKLGNETVRTNSMACVDAIARTDTGLEGRTYEIIKRGLFDISGEVQANALESLSNLSLESRVVAKEALDIFIDQAANGLTERAKIASIVGLANIARAQKITHETFLQLLKTLISEQLASNDLKKSTLLLVSEQLKWGNISKIGDDLILMAQDSSPELKALALRAISESLLWEDYSKFKPIVMSAVNDKDPVVRGFAFRSLSSLIRNGTVLPNEVIDKVRARIKSINPQELSEALYCYGEIYKTTNLSEVQNCDVSNLIAIGSRAEYSVSRAASFCLASIVNNNVSLLDGLLNEDRVEILCRVYSKCIPGLDDEYQSDIDQANDFLHSRFNTWRSSVSSRIKEDPIARRLNTREQSIAQALDVVSENLKTVYTQLQEAQKKIIELFTKTMELEVRLERERDLRRQFEGVIMSQAKTLMEMREKPGGHIGKKYAAKSTIWFLERCIKVASGQDAFCFYRMWVDIKTKLITGYILKKPVQGVFGLDEKTAAESVELLDLSSDD